jgi:hypothetical protein
MFKKIATLAIAGLLASATAYADTLVGSQTYTLTNGGSVASTPGNYGTITLTEYLNSTTLKDYVTVNLTLVGTEYFASTGAGSALAFNLDSSVGTISITNITSGFANGGADTASPFGSFLESVDCTTGCGTGGSPPHDSGPLNFTVSSTNGVNLNDFIANSGGFTFASDLFINGATGNVAAGDPNNPPPPPATPEPSSLLMLGTGIIGAAGMLRRRFVA